MPDKQVRIDLAVTDHASKPIHDVADDAKDLERIDPEIAVAADTTQAAGELQAIETEAKAVDGLSPKLDVTANVDAASSDLKNLRGDLDQTAEAAEETNRRLDKMGSSSGPRVAGNQVSDLTGPFGDASSAASDFGGIFDGLSDISEKVAGRIGVNAEAMAGAIGGIGFAVAAAAAVWTYFRQKQEEAKKKQEELVKGQKDFNDALAAGDAPKAAKAFIDTYGKIADAAGKAGISLGDFTDIVTGRSTKALEDYNRSQQKIHDALVDQSGTQAGLQALVTFDRAWEETRGKIEGAARSYAEANGTLDEQSSKLTTVASHLTVAADTTETAADNQDRFQAKIDAVNAAAEEQVTALTDQISAMTAAGDSSIAAADAQDRLHQATADAAAALREHGAKSEEYGDAVKDERDALIEAAKASQRLADDNAAAAGTTRSATDKVDSYNRALEENAKSATPAARQAAYDYLYQINQIPPDKVTEIQPLVDHGKLDEANRAINETSKARTTAVTVEADTSQADKAMKDLIKQLIDANNRLGSLNIQLRSGAGYSGTGPGGSGPQSAPPPPMVAPSVVNINMPTGSRGVDVVRQVAGHTRRNGRRYGGQVVHFARR